jgi:hypothetical protein
MRFTLVLVKVAVLEDLYRQQVFPSDGSTVVPSLSSPADLAGNVENFVVAGLRMWESR